MPFCYDSKTIDELMIQIKNKFDKAQKRIEYLEKTIQELKDEHYKDNELQEMKKELDEMKDDYYRGFPISKKEEEKIKEWIRNHEERYHPRPKGAYRGGAIGGCYTYIFTPCSIGIIGEIRCTCGKNFCFRELE